MTGAREVLRRLGRQPSLRVVAVVAVGAGSWLAAGTRPFSDAADAACGAAFAAVGVGLLAQRASLVTPAADRAQSDLAQTALWPWVVSLLLLAVWELVTYAAGLHGRRHSYPTISSLYDEAARWQGAKALAFFVWIALGWRLFRRR